MIKFKANFEPSKATHQGSLKLKIRGRGIMVQGRRHYSLSKIGFGILPNSPAGKAKKEFRSELLDYVPQAPLRGPLRLNLVITWTHLKGHVKAVKNCSAVPHFAKPDADNVAKLILDTMTELGYWYDDGQLTELSISKQFGSEPGIAVELDTIDLPNGLSHDQVHSGITKRWI